VRGTATDALGHGVVEELVVGDIEEVDAVHQGGGEGVVSIPWRSQFSHVLWVIRVGRGRFPLGGIVPDWAGLCVNGGLKKLTNEVKFILVYLNQWVAWIVKCSVCLRTGESS
jgi:hypothetical protein